MQQAGSRQREKKENEPPRTREWRVSEKRICTQNKRREKIICAVSSRQRRVT